MNNFSIPAKISLIENANSFTIQGKNNFITNVRLKVFYKGVTPDNRRFTEDFSNQVLKSLPQTPIVAFYDEDDEDFLGHNNEQYVYGYVPEIGKLGFEEIDGQTWAVTDVVLFTGRSDNIGKVAKKILGKKHSLELDPDSTKYEIVNSGDKREILFTETNGVIGLSVLGDNQEPGFTGSEFFAAKERSIEELIAQFADVKRDLSLSFFHIQEEKIGGVEMNFSTKTIAEMNEFMRTTFDEVQQKVQSALMAKGNYYYIVQISEDQVVYLDYETGSYMRNSYLINEDEVIFGETPLEVKPRFLTQDEINANFEAVQLFNSLDSENSFAVGTINEQNEFVQTSTLGYLQSDFSTFTPSNRLIWREFDRTAPVTILPNFEYTHYTTSTTTQPIIEVEKIVEVIKEQFTAEELAQIEADRIELAAFRKAQKESILNSFVEFLTEEEIADYAARLDEFTADSLEQALSVLAMKKIKQEEVSQTGEFSSLRKLGKIEKNLKPQDRIQKLIEENK